MSPPLTKRATTRNAMIGPPGSINRFFGERTMMGGDIVTPEHGTVFRSLKKGMEGTTPYQLVRMTLGVGVANSTGF